MQPKRLDATGEIAAQQGGELGEGEVEEGTLAAGLEFRRERPPEIGLDLRPAKRPQMIDAGPAAVGAPEQAAVLVELVGIGERQEQLVGVPERQARSGPDFLR